MNIKCNSCVKQLRVNEKYVTKVFKSNILSKLFIFFTFMLLNLNVYLIYFLFWRLLHGERPYWWTHDSNLPVSLLQVSIHCSTLPKHSWLQSIKSSCCIVFTKIDKVVLSKLVKLQLSVTQILTFKKGYWKERGKINIFE